MTEIGHSFKEHPNKEEENNRMVNITIYHSDGTLWGAYEGKLSYVNLTMTDDGFFQVNCIVREVVIEDDEI